MTEYCDGVKENKNTEIKTFNITKQSLLSPYIHKFPPSKLEPLVLVNLLKQKAKTYCFQIYKITNSDHSKHKFLMKQVDTTARSNKKFNALIQRQSHTDFIFCLTQKYIVETEQYCGTHFRKLANMLTVKHEVMKKC